MNDRAISAEEIAFALRQAENGVPIEALSDSLHINPKTFYHWKIQYSELFHSMIFSPARIKVASAVDATANIDRTRAYILYRQRDFAVEAELRDCKIRHSAVDDLRATLSELFRRGQKVAFYHGPVPFDADAFGAPTLLIDDADVMIQTLIDANSMHGRIEQRVTVTNINSARGRSESAFLVVSAEIDEPRSTITRDQSFKERRNGHYLWQRVESLCGINLESVGSSNEPFLLWEGSLVIRMQAIARNPSDALRTFYTSDSDVMLMGSFLLKK